MFGIEVNTYFLIAIILFTISVIMFVINSVIKKSKGKQNIVVTIIGWPSFGISLIAVTMGLIALMNDSMGMTGVWLFIFIAGIFILGGSIFFLGFGISSFVNGLNKNKEGKKDNNSIIRGIILMVLSIMVVGAVIICVTTLLEMHSNDEKPITMMVNLLWMINYLNVF